MRIFPGILLIWVISLTSYADTKWIPNFFVPEEVQTILQLVYSRLPPTKIGSDKRFGVGFRLGKNADAQILVELGPQSETQPLEEPTNDFSKRQSRQKPSKDYNNNNFISAEHKANHTKKPYKVNQNKITNHKRAVVPTSHTENRYDSSSKQRTPIHFESFGDMLMRWFRWLLQPRTESVKNIPEEKRVKTDNIKNGKVNEENSVNIDGNSVSQSVL